MRASTWVGGIAVAAFIVVSTVRAARFGWSVGATDYYRVLYAGAGGSAHVIKASLPLMILSAWQARQYARGAAGVALFVAVSTYSITSSFGLAAIQRADKIGEHAAVATVYKDRRADLDRLMAERAKIDPRPVAAN